MVKVLFCGKKAEISVENGCTDAVLMGSVFCFNFPGKSEKQLFHLSITICASEF